MNLTAEDAAVYAVCDIVTTDRRGKGSICLRSLWEVEAVGGNVDEVVVRLNRGSRDVDREETEIRAVSGGLVVDPDADTLAYE